MTYICPIDGIKIDDNQTRLTALGVFLLSLTILFTNSWLLALILAVDFILRFNNLGKFSILAISAKFVIKQLHIQEKLIDRSPKRFAALVGVLFSVAIFISLLISNSLISSILVIVLLIFASLESFIGFCAGCFVYTNFFYKIPFLKERF